MKRTAGVLLGFVLAGSVLVLQPASAENGYGAVSGTLANPAVRCGKHAISSFSAAGTLGDRSMGIWRGTWSSSDAYLYYDCAASTVYINQYVSGGIVYKQPATFSGTANGVSVSGTFYGSGTHYAASTPVTGDVARVYRSDGGMFFTVKIGSGTIGSYNGVFRLVAISPTGTLFGHYIQ